MFGKRNNVGPLATGAVMLTAATIVLGSAVHGQDIAKTYQVEVPVLNLLKQETNADNPKTKTASLKPDNQTSNQKPSTPDRPSAGKFLIEHPVESLLGENVANSANSAEQNDVHQLIKRLQTAVDEKPNALPANKKSISKGFIELSTEQLIDLGPTPEEVVVQDADFGSAKSSSSKTDNPSVEPGLVEWHSDLATAALQSKISGKPVLHFQLLGQLNQRFT